MPKKRVLIAIGALTVLFSVGWVLGHDYANRLAPASAQANLPDGKVLQQDLATQNWVFDPVDPAQVQTLGITQPILTQSQAIDGVYKQSPNLAQDKDVFGVTANLGLLNSLSLQTAAQAGEKVDSTFLKPRLVWIVTLGGLKSQSAGPQGAAPLISNELDVVVDAISGDQLMSFVWTR